MSCKHGTYDRCGVPPLSPDVLYTGETTDGEQAYRLQKMNSRGESYYTEWKLIPPCVKCAREGWKTQMK